MKLLVALLVGLAFTLGSCGATKFQVKEEKKVEEPKNGEEVKSEFPKRLEDYAPEEEEKDVDTEEEKDDTESE